MIKDLVKIKTKVEVVLSKYKDTRDNDKLLWLALMATHYDLRGVLGEEAYDNFKTWLLNNNIPTFESVTRVRRKFQEQGKYLGTNQHIKAQEELAVREWARD